jgi:segregation and condensation protein A
MDFRVDLNVFRGPLDLLLYLVRKHEVEIVDIPIAPITDQYLEYLAVLEQLDVGAVGDFLEVASTLIEIKSQQVLPRGDEVEDELGDPRQELVRRLLEYKKYRDAASILEQRSRDWQQHYPRFSNDLPPRERDPAEEPIHEVELWDLVSAFGRIIRETEASKSSNIVYDETPIHVYMSRIHARLLEQGSLSFNGLFQPGMHRSTLVGIFLAVLELVRHHQVHVEQGEDRGEPSGTGVSPV